MTWKRVLLAFVALYPKSWRSRYGRETQQLIEDLLADGQRSGARLALDLGIGAMRERRRALTKLLVGHRSPSKLARTPSLMRYRDALGSSRLDSKAEALFRGEEVWGTFAANTKSPRLRNAIAVSVALINLGFALYMADGEVLGRPSRFMGLPPLSTPILMVVYWLGSRLGGYQRIMYAITPSGLTECSVDWLARPRRITCRIAAVEPRPIEERRWGWGRYAIGERVVWLGRDAVPDLDWMTSARPKAG